MIARRTLCAIVISAVGLYYLWAVRATGDRFAWHYDLGGYYNLLGRALAHGHLYLPIDTSERQQDMVLYGGHYYLYFGVAPAVLLFTPWRLATGHDLPQNFALFVLCFGGFLFSCGSLVRVLRMAGAKPAPWILALLMLGLGICQSVPYLLLRPDVYEIAIGSGYFCLSAAIFFLTGRGKYWLAASGLLFGLAVASRPHLIFAGLIAAALLRGKKRIPLVVAFVAVGLAIGAYNYARFGNPVEFGFRYQQAGPGQNRVELAPRNIAPGVYFMLLARPVFSPVFPWIRMVFRYPFDSPDRHPFPPEYFIEPTVGALWLAPFVIAALWIPRRIGEDARRVLWIAAASSVAILCFLVSTHLMTQRYEVDFLGLAVFAAVANIGIRARGAWSAAVAVLIAYSAAANLALGIAGPYDDLLKTRPASYVRVARWFSPSARLRPTIDPRVAVEMEATFAPQAGPRHDPLIAIGHSHFRYVLHAERAAGRLRFVSEPATYEMPDPGTAPVRIRAEYVPEAHRMTVAVNGREAISQQVGMLITAPAEIRVGENAAEPGPADRRFAGSIRIIEIRCETR